MFDKPHILNPSDVALALDHLCELRTRKDKISIKLSAKTTTEEFFAKQEEFYDKLDKIDQQYSEMSEAIWRESYLAELLDDIK